MIALVPDTQDKWNEVDWALHHFLEHCTQVVDGFEIPAFYYENVEKYALEEHDIGLRIKWVSLDTFVQEPAGWELDLEGPELTAFVLKWR
jgi:hypothetical protein